MSESSAELTVDDFSGLAKEIAEIVGVYAAYRLCESYGGTRISIPASVDEKHWLSQCIGFDNATKLAAYFSVGGFNGNSNLSKRGLRKEILPFGPALIQKQRKRKLVAALLSGTSARVAAQQCGYSERSAFSVLSKLRRNGVSPRE